MPVEKQMLRQVMGQFATGVTILTLRNDAGEPTGLTANALTSVSLEPPLILVCIDKGAQSYPFFKRQSCFAVNILCENQEELSRKFAKSEANKFEGVSYHRGVLGCPVLDHTIGHLECEVVEQYPGGDHTIFVAEVKGSGMGEGLPLIFFRGGYKRL